MGAVIQMRGVGKRYSKLDEHAMLLRSVLPFARPSRRELWAVRGLDLEVAEGETVGVLGHNGAGKTTLLRLLAGVTSPTEGRVRVQGRIAPLISLGVGFHQEMSGRENVLVNGMLLGLTAKQVAERFDSIVAFAELEDFIDTPVKFYSSGMSMRLGFAVVVHVEPRILLIDEILAVGDASFQFKCFERLRALQQSGASIVMVSHSMHMIRQMCERAILIRHGRLEYDGDIEHTINLHEARGEGDPALGEDAVEFLDSELIADRGARSAIAYDDPVELNLRLRFHRTVEDPVIAVGVMTGTGIFGGFDATPVGQRWRTFAAGEEATLRITFPARLGAGTYRLLVEVKEHNGARALARVEAASITVTGRDGNIGIADLGAEIGVDESAESPFADGSGAAAADVALGRAASAWS
jgi:ABC-type polysaccharide/polyol phosphate transport system ATPase subunit